MDSESLKLQTFVFFDLETTDFLPCRITELSMVSAQREEMTTNGNKLRVINKLTLLFNPKKYIQPGASMITGENHS